MFEEEPLALPGPAKYFLEYFGGCMESPNLYGSKNKCSRTKRLVLLLSEVSTEAVSHREDIRKKHLSFGHCLKGVGESTRIQKF